MDFPCRSLTHVEERKAVKILGNYLPDEWVVREMTERDYGVDAYIEIINKDRRVTGDLIALQIKGTEEVLFNKKNQYRFDGIKVSTYNYWKGLPVVVFLVVVDLKNEIPYWVNIKSISRELTIKGNRKTISFFLFKEFCFNEVGLLTFKLSYIKEKRRVDISKAILDSLTLYNTLGPLYLYCKRKNPRQNASTTIHYMLLRHYENFSLMYRYLSFGTPIDLPEWYQKHIDYIKANNLEPMITFYYSTIMDMFEYFLHDYLKLIEKAHEAVTRTEKDYWLTQKVYIVGQLINKPLIFNEDDWAARYYYDEYTYETQDIAKCFLEDLNL